MGFLDAILHREPEIHDPVDTPIPHETVFDEHRTAHFRNVHVHSWQERRVTAIETTCTECGAGELRPNHRGRIQGQKDVTPRKRRADPAVTGARAEEIVRLHTEEHLTNGEIGRLYGISRERVRQIILEAG